MAGPLYSLTGFKAAYTLAQLLPRPVCQWLGMRIALASYARRPGVRSLLEENLQRVTGADPAELPALARSNVANFGRMLADYFLCAGLTAPQHAARLVDEWRGFEHLEAARALGRGVIVVTAHVGHWELGGIVIARHGWPLTVVTLEEPSSALTRWRDSFRANLGIRTVAVGPGHAFSFLELIQTLRRNELVAMLVDRPYSGTGAPVSFFGQAAEFSTGPALLAHHTGAAVLPAFVLQKPNGRYISFADPIIPMLQGKHPRDTLAENTQRIATSFETIIRQNPGQWFNYAPVWQSVAESSAAAAK
ncbi:MAG TPA: lysophospholipid acyltransferase family protein [Chthoniobacteraceae bacterium]|jgi:KDO2-lipid IV(A) lauroyltransferase